jgi:putative phosphoesterase
MPRFGKAVPAAVREGFKRHGVQLIVHCGDVVAPSVIPLFEALGPLEAVAGNNDPPALVKRYGRRKILEIGKFRIGVVHGHDGIGRSTLARAENAFAGEHIDAILFGHSHVPYCARHNGVLLLNPGSPTDKRHEPHYSYAILRVIDGVLDAQLEYYDDKSG